MTNNSDPSSRIGELKIDRSVTPPAANAWRWVVPALVVAAGLVWWLTARVADGAVSVEVDTARAAARAASASSILDASGYVTARREATVSSEITGKVAEVLVEEGMRVEQGQIVARLDDTTPRAQLELARAQVQSARASLVEIEAQLRAARLERDRLRDLADRKLTSTASLDTAEANFDALAARLATGHENAKVAERSAALAADSLDKMTIRAPFAGMVVSKNAQPGEMISPVSAGGGFTRTGICTIVDVESLEIEVDVNEAYIGRVSPGQRVSATLDAYPDWQIPAEVIAIIPTADRQKATVRVRIGLLERDDRVLRDMGARVAFLGSDGAIEEEHQVAGVTIARDALRTDTGGDFVWRLNNDVAQRRVIEVSGSRDSERVLVVQGLAAGDTVVRVSDNELSDGQKIKRN
ncbi:MAG TPA: efflux RND transporter periplasmic adaptor subunit [Woeseiaceae bacterium]